MTAKEQLLDRAPDFSEAQARAALTAAEHLAREEARAAIQAIGEAFSGVDPEEIEREAVRAVKEARAEMAAERHA